MICHEHKFIFIHICRCAGTSLEVFFGFDPGELNLKGERHPTPERYAQYWNEYFTFTTIRNPWDRLLSAFHFSKKHELEDSPIKCALQRYDVSEFNRFVKDVLAVPGTIETTGDKLFWPQYKWFYADGQKVEYDFIIRFENLASGISRLLDRLGIGNAELLRMLPSRPPRYRDVYDQETANLVRDLYRQDFDLLGYDDSLPAGNPGHGMVSGSTGGTDPGARRTSYSQQGQDLRVLALLGGKQGGTFVDIGCGYPVRINNTYLLEKRHGWRGLSIDFNEQLKKHWDEKRPGSDLLIRDALSTDYRALFKEHGLPRVIDYLSLDLEPPSRTYAALELLPLDEYAFNVVTFEHDEYRTGTEWKEMTRCYFAERGYVFVEQIGGQDDVYVHRSLLVSG